MIGNLSLNPELLIYVIIPLFIFFARIIDVTIGTLRIIFTNKGLKLLSALLGFFEVLVWLAAITTIMENLTNAYCYIAYAAGFATGTYVGIVIEEKIKLGIVNVRIISHIDFKVLLREFKKSEFTYTTIGAESSDGKVRLINAVVARKDMQKVINEVMEIDPNAFYSIEDIRFVREHTKPSIIKHFFGHFRKGK